MTTPRVPPWNVDPADVLRQLQALRSVPEVAADYLDARMAVLSAQAETLRALGEVELPAVDPQAPDDGPPVRPEALCFNRQQAARLLSAVIAASRRPGRGGEDLERIAAAVARRPELVEELAFGAAFEPKPATLDGLSAETGTAAEPLLLVGRLVATPFVVDAARRMRDLPKHTAAGGSCPMCGSAPGLASLEPEDGRRVLHCSLCGWSWPFARLACPLCEQQDRARLQRLSVDGEDARWIEACDRCRGYLKTIDRRRVTAPENFHPLVEEVATLYLDLVAQREGYTAALPYAAMT